MELKVTINNAVSPRPQCSLLKRDVRRGGPIVYIRTTSALLTKTGSVSKEEQDMAFQLNEEENRRVSSFRIADILAEPGKSRTESSTRSAAQGTLNTPLQHSLNFGVDQILAHPRISEHKNEIKCYGKNLNLPTLVIIL